MRRHRNPVANPFPSRLHLRREGPEGFYPPTLQRELVAAIRASGEMGLDPLAFGSLEPAGRIPGQQLLGLVVRLV